MGKHTTERGRTETVTCAICGEAFDSEAKLKEHVYSIGIVY